MFDNSILNAYILFNLVMDPGQIRHTEKKFKMELALSLTASTWLGQGRRSPAHAGLDCWKGKYFPYYHEKRKRCIVCGYKKRCPYSKSRKDTKNKYCRKCEVHL